MATILPFPTLSRRPLAERGSLERPELDVMERLIREYAGLHRTPPREAVVIDLAEERMRRAVRGGEGGHPRGGLLALDCAGPVAIATDPAEPEAGRAPQPRRSAEIIDLASRRFFRTH